MKQAVVFSSASSLASSSSLSSTKRFLLPMFFVFAVGPGQAYPVPIAVSFELAMLLRHR